MMYPGPFYKLVKVDEFNVTKYSDAPSEGVFVLRWTSDQDRDYLPATKANIASVHKQVNEAFKRFLSSNAGDKFNIRQEQNFFRGYENFDDAYQQIRLFQIVKTLFSSHRAAAFPRG